MKRLTILVLSILWGIFSIQSAFAGPFGIDMGMSLADLKQVCKTIPKHIEDNIYEITPPKTNDMFKKYIVRIDSDYGVYWMKAIGKDVYTNDYGTELRSAFSRLVESISKTYGKESYIEDNVQSGSIWDDAKHFMMALLKGDRELYAMWSKQYDLTMELFSDPVFLEKIGSTTEEEREKMLSDTTFIKNLLIEKVSEYQKLPDDISSIGIFAYALSSSMGYVSLEYSFSNGIAVQEKADSVF